MTRSIQAVVVALTLLPALTAATFVVADDAPISSGEYEIRLGGERMGDEAFRLYEKGKSYRLAVTRTVFWPEPMRFEYEVELDASRRPKKLELTTTRGGNFTELKLEPKGDNWRLEVKGRGRKTKRHELGRREGAVVDFDSILFTSLTLGQMGLASGQHETVDALVLTLPDLAGGRVSQTYRRVDDETIETGVYGTVTAAVYELDADGKTHRVWADASGLVLKATFDRLGGEREIVLKRLKSRPDAWVR